jgi:hypothetical protein
MTPAATCVVVPPHTETACRAEAVYAITATCDSCGACNTNPACVRCVASIRDIGVVHLDCGGWYVLSEVRTRPSDGVRYVSPTEEKL